MELDSDEFDKELDALKVQIDRAEELQKSLHGLSSRNSNSSNINVNMTGSHGVWLCVTLCAMSLLSCLFTLYLVSEIKQNDRDQGNQLNAIYMMAPHLKPEKKP